MNAEVVFVEGSGLEDAVVLVVLAFVSGPIGLVFSWLVVVFVPFVLAPVAAVFNEPSEVVVFDDFSPGASPGAVVLVVLVSVLVVFVVFGDVDDPDVFVAPEDVLLVVFVLFGPPLTSVFVVCVVAGDSLLVVFVPFGPLTTVFVVFAESVDEVLAVFALSVSEVFAVFPVVFPPLGALDD